MDYKGSVRKLSTMFLLALAEQNMAALDPVFPMEVAPTVPVNKLGAVVATVLGVINVFSTVFNVRPMLTVLPCRAPAA